MIQAVSHCCHTALGFSQQYTNKYCVFLPCFCLWFTALLGTIPFNNHIEVCHLGSPLPAPLHHWRASCGPGKGRWHQKPWGRVGGGGQSSSWVSPSASLATEGLAAAELVQTSVEDGALKKRWLNVELLRHTPHSHIQGCCYTEISHFAHVARTVGLHWHLWPLQKHRQRQLIFLSICFHLQRTCTCYLGGQAFLSPLTKA